MPTFGTVLTAMVTPFDADGGLDADGAQRLAKWLVEHGNDGLVVAGTTGEAPVLSDDEKVELWTAVASSVTAPVIAGATSNDTAHSVELVCRAQQTGVAGILAVTPYYNRPSQAGLEAHFRAIAEATSLPVLVYDIPVRTGRKIAHDVIVRLVRDVPNLVGVKDAALDVAGSARLVADAPEIEIYSGNDDQTLPLLSIGAVATIGVATHWTGELHQEMFTTFAKGEVDRAREINARMLPSFAFESTDDAPNPIPSKAMMRTLGLPVGTVRLPNVEPPGMEARARAVYAALDG